jgi:hypothetical protein
MDVEASMQKRTVNRYSQGFSSHEASADMVSGIVLSSYLFKIVRDGFGYLYRNLERQKRTVSKNKQKPVKLTKYTPL